MLSQKKAAFSDFGDIVKEFRDIFDDLVSGDLDYQKKVSVSDENVLSASITNHATAIPTNLDITVNQLAKADTWLSQAGTSDKDSSAVATTAGTLQITYAGNLVATIDYDTDTADSTNPSTLQEIASAINNAQSDVKASIFYDGTNYRLLLTGQETGSTKTISLSDTGDLLNQLQLGSSFSGSHVQTAQNAQIQIYGQTVESETNTFSQVLEGVSFTVKQETTSPVRLTIEKDSEPLKEKLQELFDKYNELVDFIKTNTGEKGVLSGEYTLQSIRSELFSGLSPFMDLGLISVDKDNGHISLDSGKLDDLIQNDPDTLDSKISELKTNLQDYLKAVLDPDGIIKQKDKSYQRQIQNIEDSIELNTKRINQEIQTLKNQFVALQKMMAEFQDIKNRIAGLMGSLQQPQQQQ